MKTSTETLIAAMRILSQDIQSEDGAANAAVAEAAERLAEQHMRIAHLESWINSLDEVLRYNGKDGQREWCGSEVGYLYQGQRVYVGGDKP